MKVLIQRQSASLWMYSGIGKTMFGFLVLYWWARRGERVVLVKENFYHGAPFLLSPDGVAKLDEDQLDVELGNTTTKYVQCSVATPLSQKKWSYLAVQWLLMACVPAGSSWMPSPPRRSDCPWVRW